MTRKIFFALTIVLLQYFAHAQSQSVYRSEIDNLVTVRSISLLPISDNLRGIYSRPIETHLIEVLNQSHRWEYLEASTSSPIMTPDELESDAATVKSISASIPSDAFIAMGVVKGPAGISLKMNLYLKADQKLIAQEEKNNIKNFDINSLKKMSTDLLGKLMAKLPYTGIIMSRQGTRITVNLGRIDGLTPNQVVSVIQIIKLNRHPKFNFIVGSEKEVIGKIKILKVDETLSFGRIISEKEQGAIQVNAKLGGLDEVVYANTDTLDEDGSSPESLAQRPDGKITYGSSPTAWLPQKKPTFGMVGARLGLGQYTENVQDSETLDAKAPFYPSVGLEGELWLTPVWSMHVNMRQGILSTDNPRSGAEPAELSRSMSLYEFLMGYNFRLGASLKSPKVEGLFGYSTYRMYVDESSPAGLTTKNYSGPKFGVSGSYPMPGNSPYSFGANLMFMLQAKLKESPSTSGSADNSINNFGAFIDKEIGVNLKARFSLDFDMYASDFSGSAVTSSSQKHTTLSAGIHYLF